MNNNQQQQAALLSLVQDTDSVAWSTSLTGWSSNTNVPVCDWEGITCDNDDGDSVIKQLELPSRGLSGTIPKELGTLSSLQVLNLSKNMLQGSIPQEIANLPNLITLDLTETFISGTLPQYFGSSNLSTLLLANNALSGKFFNSQISKHLPSIKEIRMENNLLTGTLHGQTMLQMSHLETLSLSDNDLSGLIPGEQLGSLPTLHYLYLDGNHFIGPLPSQLAQVGKASLLELWAQDNALSGTVPASYVRFDKLHDFFIDGNKLTGELPPDLCGPEINADFFTNVPPEAERNYCDGIACPAGSVAFEGVFPCEKCPGGEAARLKNRYLGQTGECSNYSQRDVLKIIHRATTKGGPWRGVSDWNDDDKPVCEMTGITCDAYDHVVEIALKNRGLEGHIPDEIGSLTFLESLDVSDNELMGYVPSDLQWTSLTNLDITGNKIRGMVPPLLCMMDELNGNGSDNVFYCDRIACPEGTYNGNGFHHGSRGEVCRACYDETPFIGQKTCSRTQKPLNLVQMAEDASEKMGVSPMIGLGIVVGISLVILMTCYVAKNAYYNPRKKYERGTTNEHHEHDKSASRNFKHEKAYNYNNEEEEGEVNDGNDIYSFADRGKYGQPSSLPGVYRDFVIDDEENNNSCNSPAENTVFVDYEDDDDKSRATTRSATDLMMDHQGVALNRREKLKKAVSGRMPRSVRDAASTINVGLRRNSARKSFDENDALTPGSSYESPYETTESPNDDVPANLGLNNDNAMKRKSYGKMNTGDLLDVPMIC